MLLLLCGCHPPTHTAGPYATKGSSAHGASQMAQAEAAVLDLLATSRPGARTVVHGPSCVSTRALQRRADADAAPVQQEAGQCCATWPPAHGVCNGTTSSDAVRPLSPMHFDLAVQSVENLSEPRAHNVENSQQMVERENPVPRPSLARARVVGWRGVTAAPAGLRSCLLYTSPSPRD